MAPEATAEILGANCEEWSPAYGFFGKRTKPFIGAVTGYSFKIRRSIKYANSYLPILVGNIEPRDGRSLVRIRLRMPLSTSIFMSFWFLFFVWMVISHPPTLDEKHSWASIGFLVFGYLSMQVAFWLEVPKAEKELREVFANES